MTGIEWTDEVWNPVVGCSKVSPGCEHCYAEAMDKRLRSMAGEGWRPWSAPNAEYNVRLHPERLAAPFHWRKPRRVFVNSMSDLFHERVPDEFIDRVFAVMALTPQHTFQLLTKRPERMREYVSAWVANSQKSGPPNELDARWDAARRWLIGQLNAPADLKSMGRREFVGVMMAYQRWPLPNVWLGVSVEDQRRADERIPVLLATPARVRFVSCEPLLGPVALDPRWLGMNENDGPDYLRWVIAGGESGTVARPSDLAWIRSLVAQCQAADVPVFVKQLGARPCESHSWLHTPFCPGGEVSIPMHLRDRKGGDMSEWPEDLRVREWPR